MVLPHCNREVWLLKSSGCLAAINFGTFLLRSSFKRQTGLNDVSKTRRSAAKTVSTSSSAARGNHRSPEVKERAQGSYNELRFFLVAWEGCAGCGIFLRLVCHCDLWAKWLQSSTTSTTARRGFVMTWFPAVEEKYGRSRARRTLVRSNGPLSWRSCGRRCRSRRWCFGRSTRWCCRIKTKDGGNYYRLLATGRLLASVVEARFGWGLDVRKDSKKRPRAVA